jgi:hypothetical protein
MKKHRGLFDFSIDLSDQELDKLIEKHGKLSFDNELMLIKKEMLNNAFIDNYTELEFVE